MTADSDARDIVVNALDRAAATASPFWDATDDEKAMTAILGLPAITVNLAEVARGRLPGSLLIAQTVIVEAALAELQDQERPPALSREEAIFRLRTRVRDLMG